MCSYLDMVGSTYYFRRAVPQGLIGHFLTATGKPRTDWKYSLREKDRESAKRLLRPHEIETDKLIDGARRVLQPAPVPSPAELTERQRAAEERAAPAQLDAESVVRRAARSELRTLWYRRKRTSTAMLEPEEAAAVDLIRERDATIAELRAAVALMTAANEEMGIFPRSSAQASIRSERASWVVLLADAATIRCFHHPEPCRSRQSGRLLLTRAALQ